MNKELEKICYGCGRLLTKGNKSASRFSDDSGGHPLCRKCAKFP